MPATFGEAIPAPEFADLLAYLLSHRAAKSVELFAAHRLNCAPFRFTRRISHIVLTHPWAMHG